MLTRLPYSYCNITSVVRDFLCSSSKYILHCSTFADHTSHKCQDKQLNLGFKLSVLKSQMLDKLT